LKQPVFLNVAPAPVTVGTATGLVGDPPPPPVVVVPAVPPPPPPPVVVVPAVPPPPPPPVVMVPPVIVGPPVGFDAVFEGGTYPGQVEADKH